MWSCSRPWLLLLVALPLATGRLEAQAQADGPCRVLVLGADSAAARAPDVVIRASARVEELRVGSQPRAAVRLAGCDALDTVRVLQRRNLPDPVEPGAVYRDVYVAVEVLGYLDAHCLLRRLGAAADSTRAAAAAADLCSLLAVPRGTPPREPRP